MRRYSILLCVCFALASAAQQPDPSAPPAPPADAAPTRTDFHVRYVSGTDVYIDGGSSSGLTEGAILVLKQDTSKPADDPTNAAIEPGVVGKVKVISVASTSAVCEIVETKRDLAENDVVSLPEDEVKKIIDKDAVGNSRHYPMVISFTQGDPMDEEVRDEVPRPPLPEVNEMRGRFGFDISNIKELGQGGGSSAEYGFVARADFSRIFGTHWNLNGYWRGILQRNSAAQASIQDTINRTYLMSLSYVNPNSPWSAAIGRMYLPYASSLETIDGIYVGHKIGSNGTVAAFGGSTPDPSAWDYNPQNRIGGGFYNLHGGSYDALHYSTTVGAGVQLQKWTVNRPFFFTENEFSYKKYFSLFHSMQVDRPTANPGSAPVGVGLGQSLLSARFQVHPRVTLDITDTYFRDVPTYDAILVGTGLLDKYLYQGINGGARVQFPLHFVGYVSLGESNDSNDKKNSMNQLYGLTLTRLWKTGLGFDARYSKFDSAFASGTYRTVSVTKDLGERFRLDVQGGKYAYNSSVGSASDSYFVNAMFDTNLGSRLFFQSYFTTQRGGNINYDQWTNTLGYRFDNRAAMRRAAAAAKQP